MRSFRLLLLAALLLTSSGCGAFWHGSNGTTWDDIKIGGAGFVTDIGYCNGASDLTWFIRDDTYGAWVRKATNLPWRQTITNTSVGTSQNNPPNADLGVYEIKCAPSLPSRLYAVLPGAGLTPQVWRSNDSGTTWTKTAFATTITATVVNDPYRLTGPKMAVDPANPDVVIFGDDYGNFYYTSDGGSTWAQITATSLPRAQTTVTTASTAAGNCVLHFASTPTGAVVGAAVTDLDAVVIDGVIPGDYAGITYVASIAGGDITLATHGGAGCVFGAGVALGDHIQFSPFNPNVIFDASSGTTGGKTNTVYLGWGGGAASLWKSTNQAGSFTAIGSGPSTVLRTVIDAAGTLWFVDNGTIANPGTTNAWKCATCSGTPTFTNLSPVAAGTGNQWSSVAVDPTTSGATTRVVLALASGLTASSSDNGATWAGFYNSPPPFGPLRTCTTVPWMAWTLEDFASTSNIVFDPGGGTLYHGEGIGVWKDTPPTTTARPSWTCDIPNNEEFIVSNIVSIPGSAVMVTGQDRSYFRFTDTTVYPATNGPCAIDSCSILHGWGMSYSVSGNILLGILNGGNTGVDWTGYSTDQGVTWNKFTTLPSPMPVGGSIAGSTSTNFVLARISNLPAFTTNGGTTWTNSVVTGDTSSSNNQCFFQFQNCQSIVADPNIANKFWYYDYTGLYVSTDSGANFAKVASFPTGFNTGNIKLKAISGISPTKLILAAGYRDPAIAQPVALPLYSYVAGDAAFTAVANTVQAMDAAPGKQCGSYASSIYYVGWLTISSVTSYGVFRSDDGMSTWLKIGDYPSGRLDQPQWIEGDKNTCGTVYVGFSGSGAARGHL